LAPDRQSQRLGVELGALGDVVDIDVHEHANRHALPLEGIRLQRLAHRTAPSEAILALCARAMSLRCSVADPPQISRGPPPCKWFAYSARQERFDQAASQRGPGSTNARDRPMKAGSSVRIT